MPIGLLNKIYFKKKVRARRPGRRAVAARPASGHLAMTWWPDPT